MKHSDIVSASDGSSTAKSGKILHIEHIEDIILQAGTAGAKTVAKILTDIISLLNHKSAKIKISTKFDGSPALVFGHNPENGKFFVGTKSVFNKITPKILYTYKDIAAFYSDKPELAKKLHLALSNLTHICPTTGVFQGDLLFTNDTISFATIASKNHITFTPNTLSYAFPLTDNETSDATAIMAAQMGIAVHTVYTGNTLQTMTASPLLTPLKSTNSVWVANISLDFSKATPVLTKYDVLINEISEASNLDILIDKSDLLDAVKIYFNYLIKLGETPDSAEKMLHGFTTFYKKRMMAELARLKTENGKTSKKNKILETLNFLKQNKEALLNLLRTYRLIIEVKLKLLASLNALNNIRTFIKTDTDFKDVAGEGFVVVDAGNIIKLVDRYEFSRDNFLKQDSK